MKMSEPAATGRLIWSRFIWRYWLKENPSDITFKQAPPSLEESLPLEVGDVVIPPDRLFQ